MGDKIPNISLPLSYHCIVFMKTSELVSLCNSPISLEDLKNKISKACNELTENQTIAVIPSELIFSD